MRRTEKFLISERPYAVDPTSLIVVSQGLGDGRTRYAGQIDAVWFRRRGGTLAAVAGTLWDYQDTLPAAADAFLTAHEDGRYGGSALARWDGSNLWAPQMAKVEADRRHELLAPMLENYPAVPAGYDGWWTFAPERAAR